LPDGAEASDDYARWEDDAMAKDEDLRAFLEEYGRALSRCDLPAIAAAWECPALVLDDQGVIAVDSTEQIENFFAAASQLYRDQGIVSTSPEISRVEWVSELIAEVRVRWLRWAAEERRGVELSQYTVRLDADRRPRIRVALMLPTAAA
jgi:hypothetical protein